MDLLRQGLAVENVADIDRWDHILVVGRIVGKRVVALVVDVLAVDAVLLVAVVGELEGDRNVEQIFPIRKIVGD